MASISLSKRSLKPGSTLQQMYQFELELEVLKSLTFPVLWFLGDFQKLPSKMYAPYTEKRAKGLFLNLSTKKIVYLKFCTI